MKIKHIAKVKDGKLFFGDDKKWEQDLSRHNNKFIVVVVERYEKNRSLNLNNYYWGVVVDIIANEIGDDKQSIHEILKKQFLTEKELRDGEWHEKVTSTTSLTNREMVMYIDMIKMWAANDLNIYIPDPLEKTVNNM
jgi:hypothetical protein|tara:strand:+ start:920 stop:1330 length:411 start_codon:yes stop_codon:yes gene_type:complete